MIQPCTITMDSVKNLPPLGNKPPYFPAPRTCNTCPFNDGLNEEATTAQNYGCLPTMFDMIKQYDETGVALSCHDNELACRGLCDVRPGALKSPVLSYAKWYQGEDDVRNS